MKNSQALTPPALGGPRAWFIWTFAALAFGYAFFQRVAPSVMVSDLMGEFGISAAVLGTLSALYFYPYVILQIPLGALIERYGARLLLSLALMIAGGGSIIFGTAESLPVAYLGRILIGIGSAVGFLGSLSLAGNWFPPHRFAFLAGLTMFFGMMSGVLAQAPLALVVEQFGWRSSMWALGAAGVSLGLLVALFVRNQPSEQTESVRRSSWRDVWHGLWQAACDLNVWKIAFVAAAMSGPMLTLGALWGTPYIMRAFDMPRPQAAFFVSLMLQGWAFGAPFSGWLSDRLRRRKLLLVIGSGLLSLLMAFVAFVPSPTFMPVIAALIMAGICGGAMSITFALVREVTPKNLHSSALGIVNSLTVASGAILQPVVGLALDILWDGKLIEGTRAYQASDYQWGFSLVFVVALLGFFVTLTLPRGTVGKDA